MHHQEIMKNLTAGLQFYDIFGELLRTPSEIMNHLKLGISTKNAYQELNTKFTDFTKIMQTFYDDTNPKLAVLGKSHVPSIFGQKFNANVSERDVLEQIRDEFINSIGSATDNTSQNFIADAELEDPNAVEGAPPNPVFKLLYLRHKVLRKLATENYLALSLLMEEEFKETGKRLPLLLETALYGTKDTNTPKGIFSFPVNMKDEKDLQVLSPDAFALKQKSPELIQPQEEFILNNQTTAHFLSPIKGTQDEMGSSIFFQFSNSKFELANFHNTRQLTSPLLVAGRYVLGFPLTNMGLDENGGAIAIEQGYIPPQEVEGITYKSSAPEAVSGGGTGGDDSQESRDIDAGSTDTAESGPAPCKK